MTSFDNIDHKTPLVPRIPKSFKTSETSLARKRTSHLLLQRLLIGEESLELHMAMGTRKDYAQ